MTQETVWITLWRNNIDGSVCTPSVQTDPTKQDAENFGRCAEFPGFTYICAIEAPVPKRKVKRSDEIWRARSVSNGCAVYVENFLTESDALERANQIPGSVVYALTGEYEVEE